MYAYSYNTSFDGEGAITSAIDYHLKYFQVSIDKSSETSS